MFKFLKIILSIILFSYAFLIVDAYLIGFTKFNEKVVDFSFIKLRKGAKYFMYTEKGKINIEYDLYATLKTDKILQVYRSKIFGNVHKVEVNVGDVKESFDVSYTRTFSGKTLILLFSIITIITLSRLKYVYTPGQIGLVALELIMLAMVISGHFY